MKIKKIIKGNVGVDTSHFINATGGKAEYSFYTDT